MALEWLKSILGDTYTDDVDKKVSEEIGKSFVARADFNATNEVKKTLETQLAAAGETIAGFEAMDIDSIKADVIKYKADAETAKKEAATQLEEAQFGALLDGAIRDGSGRNATAIKALMDIDTLRTSKNQSEDICATLEKIKSENDYLFEQPAAAAPLYVAGTGMAQAQATDADGVTNAFFALNPTLKG